MMLFPNGFIDFNRIRKELSFNQDPPTLYSIMESIVNYDKEESEKVKIRDLPKYAKDTIFNFTYPTSEFLNKDEFEEIFLKHYMFRRINFDTVESFRIHLDVKLNSIMPKYLLMLDGFSKLNFLGDVETHTRVTSENNTKVATSEDTSNKSETGSNSLSSSTSDSNTSTTKYSDTPQDHLTDVTDGSYITEYTEITNSGTASNTSNSTNTVSSTNVLNKSSNSTDNTATNETITITRADEIDEYKKYLEVCNSIYEMIFKECDSLFYGVI